MNAITSITREPAYAQYLPAVDTLKPGCGDVEKRHRANLMLMRDRAASALRKCSWEASHGFQAVATLTAQHIMTDMPPDMLDSVRVAVLRLYLAACQVDLAFANPDDGR